MSVVIPTFRRIDALSRLLVSVRGLHYPSIETIVVNCAPEPLEPASSLLDFGDITFLELHTESLPSRARNLGAQASSGRFLFFLDDDNVIDSEAACWLVDSMAEDPRLGLVSPLVFYLASGERIWSAGVRRGRLSSITTFPGRGATRRDLLLHKEDSCDDFPDAYMVRRSLFNEVGGYDEVHFPIHYEESDLCRRVKNAGYGLTLVPEATVWHDVPLPGVSEATARQHHVHTPQRAFFAGRNRVLFSFLHERSMFPAFLLLFLAPLTMYYLVVITSGAASSRTATRTYLGGVHEGIRYACRNRR